MTHLLDWLFGRNKIGWAKTGITSAFLGLPILLLLYGEGVLEEGGHKYLAVLLGYPIYAGLRKAYWNHRAGQVFALAAGQERTEELDRRLEGIREWNPELHADIVGGFELLDKAGFRFPREPPR